MGPPYSRPAHRGYQERLSGKDKTQALLKARHPWSGDGKGVLQEREQNGQRWRGMRVCHALENYNKFSVTTGCYICRTVSKGEAGKAGRGQTTKT